MLETKPFDVSTEPSPPSESPPTGESPSLPEPPGSVGPPPGTDVVAPKGVVVDVGIGGRVEDVVAPG